MSFTRYHDDPCRISKQAQQSSGPGRYILNVPGNGDNPCYMSNPNVRLQQWGGNLRTNTTNLESDLRGLTRNLNHHTVNDNYALHKVQSNDIQYPVCNMDVKDSRTTHPAWALRSLEVSRFDYVPCDPQKNVCYMFHNNLNTDLLERENFKPSTQKFDYL